MYIIIPVAVFAVIALIMGLMLGFASKIFAVEKDEKADLILENLPGANCGGCGYAGCSACAAAIAKGEAKITACPGCSKEKTDNIAKIMGVESSDVVPMAAFVKCSGSIDNANYKYYFDGTKSCRGVDTMNLGDKLCNYACLGYGDCVAKCNFGAISIKDSLASVDIDKCTGCGACAKECVRGVIEILPKTTKKFVKCSSKDKGITVRNACKTGCIGCRICEKTCSFGAIAVKDNLAVIDQEKCVGCGACVLKCPQKIIVKID